MADDINVVEKLMHMAEQQSKMAQQIDTLSQTVEGINTKLDKMDKLIKNDTVQDERIKGIAVDVNMAHEKIRDLTSRVTVLEQSGAEKAKTIILAIGKYVGVAIIGAIIANAKDIILLLFK